MSITEEHKKEFLGRAYVCAVTAKAGYNLAGKSEFDYGFDGTIKEVIDRGGRRVENGIGLNFQLKSSCDVIFRDGYIYYDLDAKNYNDLVSSNLMLPSILILFVLPRTEFDWLYISPEYMTLKKCAWWYSLAGLSPTENTSKRRISIPIDQVFSPEALTDIIKKIKGGDML